MRVKLLLSVFVLVLLTACQIPQYTQPGTGDADDITKEIEELTKDIKSGGELTPEEQAREEFKARLLEKQQQARAEAARRAAGARGGEVVEKPVAKPVEVVEKPVVEEVAESVQEVSTSPKRGTDGKLKLVVKEGDKVELKLTATDPDGDALSYTFGEPLDGKGRWQTKVGDAGSYESKITVSDGDASVSDTLYLTVLKVNNEPVLTVKSVTVNEGETVVLSVSATDADGDQLSYTYSGWMNGPTKETGFDDAGSHDVTVSVTDGKDTVSVTTKVVVVDVNRPPSFTIG